MLLVGRPNTGTKKLPIQLSGWPRISMIADDMGMDGKPGISALIDRSSLAYRGRRLFDTAEVRLEGIAVDAATGNFTLKQEKAVSDSGLEWKLTRPPLGITDAEKATQLAGQLAGLSATEYINDSPKPEELVKFGLDKPKQTITLSFVGSGGRDYKLELGGPREGKPEVYARLNGGGVFGVTSAIADLLNTGAIGLLPMQLWPVPLDKVTAVEITRTEGKVTETYALAKEGTNWKLTGPFDASVLFVTAQPTISPLVNVRAVRYQSLTVRIQWSSASINRCSESS